ncbi:MAG: hypothetical protein HQL96_10750 [Magnetococcales bacterium]|nr:hypothetical protein [Magnetococcales bacterium]
MNALLKFLAVTWTVLLWSTAPVPAVAGPEKWSPLEKDGLHDPQGPAIHELQQPGEALSQMPPDSVGNQVRWVEALRKGTINPRTNILPETKIQVLDQDLIYGNTGDNWFVLFPHKAHTEWLDCANCHERIFKTKFGATGFKMMDILAGKACGQCHGAVSFPLTECRRCHSIDPGTFKGKLGAQQAAGGKP